MVRRHPHASNSAMLLQVDRVQHTQIVECVHSNQAVLPPRQQVFPPPCCQETVYRRKSHSSCQSGPVEAISMKRTVSPAVHDYIAVAGKGQLAGFRNTGFSSVRSSWRARTATVLSYVAAVLQAVQHYPTIARPRHNGIQVLHQHWLTSLITKFCAVGVVRSADQTYVVCMHRR